MKPVCHVELCPRFVKALGLCQMHYTKLRKYGDPLGRKMTALERYEAYTDRTTTPNGCHLWISNLSPRGYGKFYSNGKHWRAHRFGWTVKTGSIPDGLIIRHFVCDNPPCQNLDHLRIGTPKDNIHDMFSKDRQRFGTDYNNGSANSNAKLTESDVTLIRAARAAGATGPALAYEFGVSPALIYAIVNRKAWTHVA